MRVLTVLAILLVPALLFAQNKPLVVVRLTKTESIGSEEFEQKLAQAALLTQQPLTDLEKSILLDQLIDTVLLLQQAEKESFTVGEKEVLDGTLALLSRQQGRQVTEAEIRLQLQRSGTSFADFIDEASKQFILQKYISAKFGADITQIAEPSAAEIEDFYNSYPQQFVVGDRVRFQQIFTKTLGLDEAGRLQARKRADDLFRRVQNGELLAELAATYSEESVSRDNQGDVGYVARNDEEQIKRFGKDFFDQLFQAEEGQLKMIESNVGFHIVEVKDFKPKELLGLNDPLEPGEQVTVRAFISNGLKQRKQQEKVIEIQRLEVQKLRRQASIRIFEENIPFKYESPTT